MVLAKGNAVNCFKAPDIIVPIDKLTQMRTDLGREHRYLEDLLMGRQRIHSLRKCLIVKIH